MLNVLVLGDIHGDILALRRIRELVSALNPELALDVIVATGDFLNYAPRAEERLVRHAIEQIEAELGHYHRTVICVPGNHDRPDLWKIDGCLQSVDVLNEKPQMKIGGLRFLGFGGSWTMGGFPYEWKDGDSLVQKLQKAMPKTDEIPEVLLTHAPPIGANVGMLRSGREVGSIAVKNLILARRPLLSICGHIHEASGWGKLGNTHILNAGSVAGIVRINAINQSLDSDILRLRYVYSHASFHILQLNPKDETIMGVGAYLLSSGLVKRRIEIGTEHDIAPRSS